MTIELPKEVRKLNKRQKSEMIARLLSLGTGFRYENSKLNPLPDNLEAIWGTITKSPIPYAKAIMSTI